MKHLTTIALIFSFLVACGDESAQNGVMATGIPSDSSGNGNETLASNMSLYETRSALPLCDDSIENAMAYVRDEKRLYACSDSLWKAVCALPLYSDQKKLRSAD